MSIRFKLILSNILMIIIPLVSAVILAVILIGMNNGKSGWGTMTTEITDRLPSKALKNCSYFNDV